MRSFHFKALVSSGDSFKAMRRAMEQLNYEARMGRGFILGENAPSGGLAFGVCAFNEWIGFALKAGV